MNTILKSIGITAATLLALPAAGLAQYSQTCGYDLLGAYRCSNSLGGSMTIRRDPLGSVTGTYRDPRGGHTTCTSRRDFLGKIQTNCY